MTGAASPGRLGGAWFRLTGWLGRWIPGREARRRARESDERLRLALDAAGMAIWEMDAETGAMWWSAQAGRLFGMSDGEEATRTRLPHVVQRIHPDDRAPFQAAVAEAVARAGEIHRIQSRVVRPDGTIRWIEARGQSWLDSEGRLRGLRGSLVDVTELKRGEEDLRRRLEELRVVAAVAECAAEAGDEEALLARTTVIIRDAFFPESCGFLLRDEESGLVYRADSFHPARRGRGLSANPVSAGLAGEVVASG
ncbi:MAG: PAS domain S-box protein, partial [Acidobacteriota bacterium]